MEFSVWLTYLFTLLMVSLTPGPAVLLVVSQGFRHGASTSNFGAYGVSAANLVFFLLSAGGLTALIKEASAVFEFIKIAGAVYIVFIGVKMLITSWTKAPEAMTIQHVEAKTYRLAFTNAFITQIANPKAIVFFLALLPQFINPLRIIIPQFSILAFTHISVETLILMGYGWLGATGATTLKDSKHTMKWVDRIGGGVLLWIGINLFFMKSR